MKGFKITSPEGTDMLDDDALKLAELGNRIWQNGALELTVAKI